MHVFVHKLRGSTDTATGCDSCIPFCFVLSLTANCDGFESDVANTNSEKKQFLCKLLFSCNVVILLSVILTHEVYSKNYCNRKHNQVLGVITHYLRTQGALDLSICV